MCERHSRKKKIMETLWAFQQESPSLCRAVPYISGLCVPAHYVPAPLHCDNQRHLPILLPGKKALQRGHGHLEREFMSPDHIWLEQNNYFHQRGEKNAQHNLSLDPSCCYGGSKSTDNHSFSSLSQQLHSCTYGVRSSEK